MTRCSARTFTLGREEKKGRCRCQELPFSAVSSSARPRHISSLLPSRPVGRRSIHWSDIPLRSREERCSVGVENRARARPRPSSGAQVALAGGGGGRRLPLTDVAGKAGIGRGGVTQPRSRIARAAKEEEDLYAIRMRKAAAAASAKSVCLSPAA